MESSDTPNCTVRVKREPSDVLLTRNESEMIDEKPDLKNIQLLPLAHENSTCTLRKCNINCESELNDEVEIVVECEDVKPNINLLTVKIEDDFQRYLPTAKDRNSCKIENIIKVEPAEEVRQELVGDAAEESSLNFDCELVEQNKKTGVTKKARKERRSKTHIGTKHNDTTHPCEICRKNFSTKGNLDRHVKSLHDCITYPCDICGKTFSQKTHLKIHTDAVHNGVLHACDICGKSFKRRDHLKVHIDSVHNSVTHACDTCGKKFSWKCDLKNHINAVHIKIIHACGECGKEFVQKRELKRHIDVKHNSARNACDKCGIVHYVTRARSG